MSAAGSTSTDISAGADFSLSCRSGPLQSKCLRLCYLCIHTYIDINRYIRKNKPSNDSDIDNESLSLSICSSERYCKLFNTITSTFSNTILYCCTVLQVFVDGLGVGVITGCPGPFFSGIYFEIQVCVALHALLYIRIAYPLQIL